MTNIERPDSGRRSFSGFFGEGAAKVKWFGGALAACGVLLVSAQGASAETRSLKLWQLHTGEKAEIVFKRNGRFDQAGLKKINYILRDWRKNQPTNMNPRLLDLIWEAYREAGASGYINVVCGYRSPGTNAMLKSRSRRSGVAEKSQHMLGNAMDFFIPGVKLKKLREIGLKMQGGGVGYYPTSGSPFVHFDVGNVRHWPKMSRSELVALFPNGKTLHVPSDGKPLPGFEQALASYKARQGKGELAIASAMGSGGGTPKKPGFFARLFGGGGGADDEEDSSPVEVAEDATPAPAPKVKKAAPVVAQAKQPGIQIVSPAEANRVNLPQADEQPEAPAAPTLLASLPARGVPLPAARPEDAPKLEEAVTDTLTEVAAAAPPTLEEGVPPELSGDADETASVAADVPLPSWRPAYAPQPNPGAGSEADPEAAVLTALADANETREKAATLLTPLPADRPIAPSVAALVNAMAPKPAAKPAQLASAGENLPAPASVPGFAKPDDAAALAAAKANAERSQVDLASLSADDKRLALASAFAEAPLPSAKPLRADNAVARPPAPAKEGRQLAAILYSNVRTTGKAARPTRNDRRPEAQPKVVAAQPSAARWAIHGQTVASAPEGAKGPAFAFNLVGTPPREVYAAGFQQGGRTADANRFSGKAVQFMTVARFKAN